MLLRHFPRRNFRFENLAVTFVEIANHRFRRIEFGHQKYRAVAEYLLQRQFGHILIGGLQPIEEFLRRFQHHGTAVYKIHIVSLQQRQGIVLDNRPSENEASARKRSFCEAKTKLPSGSGVSAELKRSRSTTIAVAPNNLPRPFQTFRRPLHLAFPYNPRFQPFQTASLP